MENPPSQYWRDSRVQGWRCWSSCSWNFMLSDPMSTPRCGGGGNDDVGDGDYYDGNGSHSRDLAGFGHLLSHCVAVQHPRCGVLYAVDWLLYSAAQYVEKTYLNIKCFPSKEGFSLIRNWIQLWLLLFQKRPVYLLKYLYSEGHEIRLKYCSSLAIRTPSK